MIWFGVLVLDVRGHPGSVPVPAELGVIEVRTHFIGDGDPRDPGRLHDGGDGGGQAGFFCGSLHLSHVGKRILYVEHWS